MVKYAVWNRAVPVGAGLLGFVWADSYRDAKAKAGAAFPNHSVSVGEWEG